MKGLFDKKRQGRGRHPKEGGLTREIAGIIIGLVAGTVALCWVLNTVFLERYYVMNKENVLLSGFTTIDAASEDGSLDDSSFDVTFDNLCANGNITVMVISPDRTIVRSSVNDTQRMLIEFTDIIFGGTQNVSHELKTPLALIQGYAEGLKECINDDAQSRDFYCEVIMDEADKMNQMVKKLLTLNQLESGNETITMERFDVTELIRGVLHSVDILIGQSGITVTECPAEPIYVWADEFMTEEVVTNYLSNAIHYAGGKKEISIRCREQEKNVRIRVFNTGDPIPEEDIDKIWSKFYKVDKARTREYGGSGIGLSIVKAIMDSFHQQCGVINHEDGVEFWFELEKGKQS